MTEHANGSCSACATVVVPLGHSVPSAVLEGRCVQLIRAEETGLVRQRIFCDTPCLVAWLTHPTNSATPTSVPPRGAVPRRPGSRHTLRLLPGS